jgi:hypothetical protein
MGSAACRHEAGEVRPDGVHWQLENLSVDARFSDQHWQSALDLRHHQPPRAVLAKRLSGPNVILA